MTATSVEHAGNRPCPGRALDRGLGEEVLRGLRDTPKTLPAKLLYDARGACLFEQITTLEEYYLTRAELEILTARAGEIAALAGPRCALIEYGSGAGRKASLLLDTLEGPAAYVPIDISGGQLAQLADAISARHPDIAVRPLCVDYSSEFHLPALPPRARRLAFFPGSTIGNLHPADATALLHRIRRTVGAEGALILGVDRRKDTATLEAAYDDRLGVTATFNLNVLTRLNRELNGDFDLARFRHRIRFDATASRIEMHLESRADQTVYVAGTPIAFRRGETIRTECSYKYDREHLDRVVAAAGFSVDRLWTDDREQFWVAFLTPATTRSDRVTQRRISHAPGPAHAHAASSSE